jgi:hypothetical protein
MYSRVCTVIGLAGGVAAGCILGVYASGLLFHAATGALFRVAVLFVDIILAFEIGLMYMCALVGGAFGLLVGVLIERYCLCSQYQHIDQQQHSVIVVLG